MQAGHVKLRIMDEANLVVVGLRGEHVTHLYDQYGVFAPNYFFNPKFKLGVWDGKIRYFSKKGTTYLYLIDDLLPRIVKLGYKVELEDLRAINIIQPDLIKVDILKHIPHADTDEPILLRDDQVDGVNALIETGYGICVAGTGAGKAQPLTAKVLCEHGWKFMGDIKVGDQVLTASGKISNVLGVFPQGPKEIYEMTFHDGSKTRACKEHLWETRFPKQNHKAWTETRIVSTADIIEFLERKQTGLHTPGNISIPLCNPIELPVASLPIDPYVLGALIGDGTLQGTPVFSNQNDEILQRINDYMQTLGIKMSYVLGSNCDYRLSKQQKQNTFPPSPNALTEKLKELHLWNKHSKTKFIPNTYKQSSSEQRWEIIRGLFDTDGTVGVGGSISFTTVSQQLALDVQEIIWSLGGTCTITSRKTSYFYENQQKEGQLAYTCFVGCKTPSNLFFTQSKRRRCKLVHGNGRIELTRRITSVKCVGTENAQCILIDDPTHLYITDDYIVTHNTLMCVALVKAYGDHGIKSLTIVPDQTLIAQTKAEYINCGLDTGEYSGLNKTLDHQHVVSTWQALQNNPRVVDLFEMIIVDECHGLKGQVLKKILIEHAGRLPYRFGFTGTLPKEPSDQMAVHVAVGPKRFEMPARTLQEKGVLATLQIDILQLEEDLKAEWMKFCKEEAIGKPPTYIKFKDQYYPDYTAEKSYLHRNKKRIEWIADMIEVKRDQKKGNVLCLVDNIAFGRKLAAHIKDAIFVNGKDVKSAADRKEIYDLFKEQDNLVVIATVHIAGTGLNIRRIFNLITIDVGKSFIRVVQAIGRGLRKADDKDHVTYTDVCSDLKYSKKHCKQRMNYYDEQQYPYKKHKIKYTDRSQPVDV